MKAMRKSNLGRSLLLVVPLVCCPYTAHKAYAGSVLKPSCKPTLLSTQFHKPI